VAPLRNARLPDGDSRTQSHNLDLPTDFETARYARSNTLDTQQPHNPHTPEGDTQSSHACIGDDHQPSLRPLATWRGGLSPERSHVTDVVSDERLERRSISRQCKIDHLSVLGDGLVEQSSPGHCFQPIQSAPVA
jgi:hypothetical protein